VCRDCYEVDLPEPTWLEELTEDKEIIKVAGATIGIPTGLFIASCFLIYFANKKGMKVD
jgi:hypothetical protein